MQCTAASYGAEFLVPPESVSLSMQSDLEVEHSISGPWDGPCLSLFVKMRSKALQSLYYATYREGGGERERETKEKTTASQVEIIASQHELSLLRAIWKIMGDILAVVQSANDTPVSSIHCRVDADRQCTLAGHKLFHLRINPVLLNRSRSLSRLIFRECSVFTSPSIENLIEARQR